MNRHIALCFFGLAFSTYSVAAMTADYTIDFEAQLNGAKPVHGSLTVSEGKTGAMTLEGTTIWLTPTRTENGAVKIEAEFLKNAGQGLKTVYKSSLITRLNSAAEITEKNGAKETRLKVTPRVM